MQFTDSAKIYAKAGAGGHGVVAWRREPNVPEGGPWGGEGGKGGDVVILGDHNVNTLFDLRNRKNVFAQDGGNGGTQLMSGKTGDTAIIRVPVGTSVYDSVTNELLCDVLEAGKTFVLCHGGKGGHGNAYFKSSFNRIPSLYENGDLPEERNVDFKLRYIADVGMCGFPNAGKSTFVSQVSNAKPRIADYQFTTLIPVLGTVDIKGNKLVFEDIPGIIEGASEGKGLGFEFLKHIERCYVLIHLISLSPEDNEDIIKSYETIKDELRKYGNEVSKKPMLLVANKIDAEGAEQNLEILKKHIDEKIFVISAKEKTNIDEVLNEIYVNYAVKVEEMKAIELEKQKEIAKQNKIVLTDDDGRKYSKKCFAEKIDDHTYEIKSEYLKYWLHKIPLKTADNNIRFNQKLQAVNGENKAKALGAVKGDTLLIYGTEFVVD